MSNDFLFRGDLSAIDPAVAELINLEAERQVHRLIMIPSESTIPWAVREALTSAFHNVYAEGYPPDDLHGLSEAELMDVDLRLADYRRYADPRYYKGTEFANLIEALARRRCAELFATPQIGADGLYVNVQPLSGAPANSAVYTALIQPGDTIMGLDLLHGGHLSHGSPAARSGKQYRAVYYRVDPATDLIDYDHARAVALAERPKVIIGGYTSYPWAPDWAKLRAIADEVGAYLLADVSHVSGLIIAGEYPSPVGVADVTMFTTHKTLGGPRGAVLITHKADLAKKIDRGVFPGEQGGPHVNTIAALAVALKLATTPQFHELQVQTVRNATRLVDQLKAHGLRIQHGGTDTHLLLVDLKSIVGADGTTLSGDMAARILDLVGITANRNTLPGDATAARPSGLRLGTPWITQRGFREPQIDRLAEIIATVLKACQPFSYDGKGGKADARARIDFETYLAAQEAVAALCNEAGIDYTLPVIGDQMPTSGRGHFSPFAGTATRRGDKLKAGVIHLRGAKTARFLSQALTSNVEALTDGDSQPTLILHPDGSEFAPGIVTRDAADRFTVAVPHLAQDVAAWLRALADGFVIFNPADPYAKLPGPVVVVLGDEVLAPDLVDRLEALPAGSENPGYYDLNKPYFVGCNGSAYSGPVCAALPPFQWAPPAEAPLKRTTSYDLHLSLGARMTPFAGYEMPVWYTDVLKEHAAVRTAAGVFDVTHMGVWEVIGATAESFLDAITTNDVTTIAPGESQYSYLLGVDGVPIDDIFIYRLAVDRFMVVVNAANDDQDWAWVNAIHAGNVQIDSERPGANLLDDTTGVTIRNLRGAEAASAARVDVALQGPTSRDMLLALDGSDADKAAIKGLAWGGVIHATLGGFDLIVSRTGYTGERIAFELFVHPDQAPALIKLLIDTGATPCGLASRDSLRIEAGLPLYGHELGTAAHYTPGDAGFASYVKLWKPFFIGKQGYLTREARRNSEVTRFRVIEKRTRAPQPGDAVLNADGALIGVITSCSVDSDGYRLGQAYLRESAIAEGTPIQIALSSAGTQAGATVLSRFPKAKKAKA